MLFVGLNHATTAFFTWAIILCGCLNPATSLAQEGSPKFDLTLTDGNYDAWRDHILPDPNDLDWQQIPWLTTFQDGIRAAHDADKPLLLWTMNGHPLGCT